MPPGPRVKVTVRHRREGQDVVNWIDDCMHLVGMDHRGRSPQCRFASCDLMIPMSDENEKGIGYA